MTSFILGATALASLVAALFFLRFWRDTRDRFFCFFAIAFGVDALHRVVLALTSVSQEHEPFMYGGRLVTYGLIIAAIVDKNRPRASRGPGVRSRSFTTSPRVPASDGGEARHLHR
jgi:hypothetical protein